MTIKEKIKKCEGQIEELKKEKELKKAELLVKRENIANNIPKISTSPKDEEFEKHYRQQLIEDRQKQIDMFISLYDNNKTSVDDKISLLTRILDILKTGKDHESDFPWEEF